MQRTRDFPAREAAGAWNSESWGCMANLSCRKRFRPTEGQLGIVATGRRFDESAPAREAPTATARTSFVPRPSPQSSSARKAGLHRSGGGKATSIPHVEVPPHPFL